MKIQKGQKLTEEQKAQRAESRRRNTENTERRLRDHEEQKIIQAAKDEADRKEVEAIRAQNALFKAEGRLLAQRFVIDVTEEERQVLFEISRRFFTSSTPGAAHWAMRFALCHSEQLLNWISGLIRYEQAEGLNQFDQVKGKIEMAAKQLARERV
jgi:hypothetical protein